MREIMRALIVLAVLMVAGCGGKDGPHATLLPDGTIGSAVTYWTGTGDQGKPAAEELERMVRINDCCKPEEDFKVIVLDEIPAGAGRKITSVFKCQPRV